MFMEAMVDGDFVSMPVVSMEEALEQAGVSDEMEYTDEGNEKFRQWMERENGFYYARPREEFFQWEAVGLAHRAGASFLVLEDMS